MLGISFNSNVITILGFSGALLHVINHAIFKGLLFLSAGSVISQVHSRNINNLGGLFKKMPVTGFTFLIGSIAISGLPPLNGFISELLIYLGTFKLAIACKSWVAIFSVLAAVSLALIGGLALTCFSKVFSMIFLGEARNPLEKDIIENSTFMTLPMIILSIFCIFIGLFPVFILKTLQGITIAATKIKTLEALDINFFPTLSIVFGVFYFSLFLFFIIKKYIISKRIVTETVTWDCGFIKPTPKMQYSATSFAAPITDLFGSLLKFNRQSASINGYFPKNTKEHSELKNLFLDFIFTPIAVNVKKLLAKVLPLQQGSTHLYIVYIVAVLIVLLIWKL